MKKSKILIPLTISVLALIVALIIGLKPSPNKAGDDLSVHLSSGQQFLVQLDYDRAIAEFEAVIAIDPKNVDAYIGLAECYQAKGDDQKAADILKDGYNATNDDRIKNMLDQIFDKITPEEITETEQEEEIINIPNVVNKKESDILKVRKVRYELYGL